MLRALEISDLDFLYAIENDACNWCVGSQTAPISRYHLQNYLTTAANDIYKDEQVRLVIEDNGVPVGLVDLFNFDPKHMRAEVGIVVTSEYQGNGLATQAVADIVNYARVIHLHQLYAVVPASNTQSAKVFCNNGFDLSAELRDWIYDGSEYKKALFLQKIL